MPVTICILFNLGHMRPIYPLMLWHLIGQRGRFLVLWKCHALTIRQRGITAEKNGWLVHVFDNVGQCCVVQKHCVDEMETPESIFACLRRNKDEDNFDRRCMKMIVLREELRAQGSLMSSTSVTVCWGLDSECISQNDWQSIVLYWLGSLAVACRTSDREVTGSTPGHSTAG